MNNPSFEDDEKLPGPSASANNNINSEKKSFFAGLFTWREVLEGIIGKNPKLVTFGTYIVIGVAYHAYFLYCLFRHINEDIPIFSCSISEDTCPPEQNPPRPYWCDSFGFLVIVTSLAWAGIIYGYLLKPMLNNESVQSKVKSITLTSSKLLERTWVTVSLYILVITAIAVFIFVDTWDDRRRLVGAGGALVFILIGWIFSVHPDKVRWRHIVWGHSIQFVFALIALRWKLGNQIVQCLSSKVGTFLNYTYLGADFVFGYLATGRPFVPEAYNKTDDPTLTSTVQDILTDLNNGVVGVPFFFGPLSIIYFVSFFVSMLYYWGTLQFIVRKIGWLLYISVGTTAAESMNAAANIFLGQTEAPLLIRPFLSTMTRSEINSVMTGGFATIAGTILGAYIAMGIPPEHLITCSFMAAPASLAVSKLFYPETETSKTTIKDIKVEKGEESNVLDAAAKGASNAIMLILNIGASLLAFYAFIKFLDDVVMWFGHFAGWDELSFSYILGYILYPVAFLIGIEQQDCKRVGELIGEKLLITEFTAFIDLADSHEKGEISERSFYIATYALCGFANFPSIGIQIGGFGAMSPERKSDFAQIALRAMIGGCWVSFLNACIAGTLISV